MPISQQDAMAILNYAANTPNLHSLRSNPSISTPSPCADFACALIESATGKRIIERDLIFQQDTNPFLRNLNFHHIRDYIAFRFVPAGRILGIYDTLRDHIIHYVVKLQDNIVIGHNHGGIWATPQRILNRGLFVYIIPNDFNAQNYFIYDVTNPDQYYLVFFDYTLR